MSEQAHDALRAAVNIARDMGVRTKAELVTRLLACGHSAQAADEAVKFWADYERRKVAS